MSECVTLETELVTGVTATTEIEVVELAMQGPPGPSGVSGTNGAEALITRAAVSALGGHRVVVHTDDGAVTYADHTNLLHADLVLGLTMEAAASGAAIRVLAGGEITEPSWAWDITTPIYLGTNGLLTQTPPVTGFLQQVAIPLSATSIYWQPQPAILLE